MTDLVHLVAGLLLGAGATSLHMLLLHRAIEKASSQCAQSRSALALSAPLRLALWVPVLIVVARMGLVACLGTVASLLIGRAVLIGRIRPEVV